MQRDFGEEEYLRRCAIVFAERNYGAISVNTAQRNLDLAHAQRHRDLDVALEYQRNGGDNTIGATVSFPLFLSHKFEGQINQGLAQIQQANVALDQAKLQAITDVEKAYQAYQASRQILQVYTTEALARASSMKAISPKIAPGPRLTKTARPPPLFRSTRTLPSG